MYIPEHFAADERSAVALLANIDAADLITVTQEGPVATFLPLLYDPGQGEHGALLGHVARTNDQWRRPTIGESLVIAHGVDGYVSPSYYASKAEHGRVVPTWNYVTAHVYGSLIVHDDTTWLADLVRRLTDRHEAAREHPWSMDDAPAVYVEGQLRAIVGVELRISRIEAKAKLSQNRPSADIDGVIAGFERDGRPELGAAVRAARPESKR
ncbi:MAG TPA: FMN-binding negative transcriptional regulator [Actinospica sp.]|nr:FMN-binding negative transcriptional regulator [Actinospica sp.]